MQFERPSTLNVIESHVVMDGFDEDGSLIHTEAVFSYDPGDPFAMTVVLRAVPRDVRWTFARDLLIDGMFEPAGEGDVTVFPCLDLNGSTVTVLELRSPGGTFMAQAPQRELAGFARAMSDTVPLGAESMMLDMDQLISQLMEPQE